MLKRLVISLIFAALSFSSIGMTIDARGGRLILQGPVLEDDVKIVQHLEGVTHIMLKNSGGGDVSAAIELGYQIRARKISTSVEGFCYSACALIFLGGEHRNLSGSSVLGFHGARTSFGTFNWEVNSRIIDYVSMLTNEKFPANLLFETFRNLFDNDLLLIQNESSAIYENNKVRKISEDPISIGVLTPR